MDSFERAEKVRDLVKIYFMAITDEEITEVLGALKATPDRPAVSELTAHFILDLRNANYIPPDAPIPLA